MVRKIIKKQNSATFKLDYGNPAHIKTLEELKTEFGDNAAFTTMKKQLYPYGIALYQSKTLNHIRISSDIINNP